MRMRIQSLLSGAQCAHEDIMYVDCPVYFHAPQLILCYLKHSLGFHALLSVHHLRCSLVLQRAGQAPMSDAYSFHNKRFTQDE